MPDHVITVAKYNFPKGEQEIYKLKKAPLNRNVTQRLTNLNDFMVGEDLGEWVEPQTSVAKDDS